jgi:centromere/kinetochore protein ZW10
MESTNKPENAGTPVSSFLDHQAGLSWANLRRSRVGDQVRRLIISGWAGWEAVEISRDKEISIVVEVEVDDEEVKEDLAMEIDTNDKPDEAIDSWGFDVPDPPTTDTGKTKPEETVQTEEEGGWDFEEPTIPTQSEAGPSSPRRPPADDVEDGWAFDDDLSTPAPPPPSKPAPKPMREAKKLGKKVAKSKLPQEDQESGMESEEMSRTNSIASATPPRAATPPLASAEAMHWEAWDDEAKKDIKPKTKRKVLKDEKRVIKETFLVSKACDTLLELAESVLRDAKAIAES